MILLPVVWFIVHWIVPRIYISLCVPQGFGGFIQSVFLVSSHHCVAMRYMVSIACFNINYIWLTLGTTLMGYLSTRCNVQTTKTL